MKMRMIALLCTTILVSSGANAQAIATAEATSEPQAQPNDAQEPAPTSLGDIVVTAQRQSASVQRTPLAITAVAGDALRASGISNVDALTSSVPNLQLGQNYGTANLSLRGISLNAQNFSPESPIAFHGDGVFISRTGAVLSGLYDLERIEVLRGAQGTLYGRNATGGSVNVITSAPTREFSGYAQLTAGNYDHVSAEGAVSGTITGDLLARLSFRSDDRSGYGINEITRTRIDDAHERSVRGKLEYRPGGTINVLLAADYSQQRDRSTPHYGGQPVGDLPYGVIGSAIDLGGVLPTSVRNIASTFDPMRRATYWGLSGRITADLGVYTLSSLSAFRRAKIIAEGDLDQNSSNIADNDFLFENSSQISQEFQLTRKTENDEGVFGLYYFHEVNKGANNAAFNAILTGLFGDPDPQNFLAQGYYAGNRVQTDAYAVFGQYTRHLTEQFSITLGARYSIERKEAVNQNAFDLTTPYSRDVATSSFRPQPDLLVQCGEGLPTIGFSAAVPCQPDNTWKSFTPKVAFEYKPAERVLMYASYSKGFKSGVFNLGVAQAPVEPERIDDYEVGIKSTFLDNRVRLNLAGFYYDYTNLQVQKVVGASVTLENAAGAQIYGVEAELLTRPVDGFQLDANLAYLHSEFTRFISADPARPGGDGRTVSEDGSPAFDLEGNRLPQAPRLSGKVGATIDVDAPVGTFKLRGELSYIGLTYFTPFNLETASVGDRFRQNASLTYTHPDGHLTAALNVRNLSNRVRATNGFVATNLLNSPLNVYLEAPRTIDLTVGYRF